jgi:hypothetical protein
LQLLQGKSELGIVKQLYNLEIFFETYLAILSKVSAAALDSNGFINKVSGFSPKLFEAK